MAEEKKSGFLESASSKFSETVGEHAAKNLFELVWSLASVYGKKAADKVAVSQALKRYKAHYLQRYGEIKVLGMNAPVPLDRLYTRVRLVRAHAGSREIDMSEYEQRFRRRIALHLNSSPAAEASEVVSRHARLNVLGAPGSGKSTLLKKIGLSLLTEGPEALQLNADHLPVLIELKKFGHGLTDLKQQLQAEFENAGFPDSSDFLDHALKSGKLLILLDGLDEIPKAVFDTVTTQIRDLTDRYPANRFITSCRTAFYKNFLGGFSDIEIASFDDQQIRIFVANWFSEARDLDSGTAARFDRLLFDRANLATLELARTPLLLTFLCLSYDEGQQFPANRSSLYRRAMQILLEKWAAEKRIHHEDIYQDLNTDIEIEMLAEVAAFFYDREQTLFLAEELNARVRYFLENTMDLKLPPVSRIIEAIEVQQGLLVQRSADVYSFSHLTIQEYLTAFYYYVPGRMPQLIAARLFDAKWREVFLLQAGMSHSEGLLREMLRVLKAHVEKHEVLKTAIAWVNRQVRTGHTEKDACVRVLLLGFLLRYRRDRGAEISSTMSTMKHYSPDLGQLLDKDFHLSIDFPLNVGRKAGPQILDVLGELTGDTRRIAAAKKEISKLVPDRPLAKMPPGSRYTFNKQILLIINRTFKVPELFDNLRVNKYDPINEYLDGMARLVECRHAALRVSPGLWSEILNAVVR